MGHSVFVIGEHAYQVVPSESDDFAIIDLECDCELVDVNGEVADEDSRCHRYATEREAEGAILRWKRRADDRRDMLAMGRKLRELAERQPSGPGTMALVDLMFPAPAKE